jgi:hypothetical protein
VKAFLSCCNVESDNLCTGRSREAERARCRDMPEACSSAGLVAVVVGGADVKSANPDATSSEEAR